MFRRKSDSVMPEEAESASAKVNVELQRALKGFDRVRSVTVHGRIQRTYLYNTVCTVVVGKWEWDYQICELKLTYLCQYLTTFTNFFVMVAVRLIR